MKKQLSMIVFLCWATLFDSCKKNTPDTSKSTSSQSSLALSDRKDSLKNLSPEEHWDAFQKEIKNFMQDAQKLSENPTGEKIPDKAIEQMALLQFATEPDFTEAMKTIDATIPNIKNFVKKPLPALCEKLFYGDSLKLAETEKAHEGLPKEMQIALLSLGAAQLVGGLYGGVQIISDWSRQKVEGKSSNRLALLLFALNNSFAAFSVTVDTAEIATGQHADKTVKILEFAFGAIATLSSIALFVREIQRGNEKIDVEKFLVPEKRPTITLKDLFEDPSVKAVETLSAESKNSPHKELVKRTGERIDREKLLLGAERFISDSEAIALAESFDTLSPDKQLREKTRSDLGLEPDLDRAGTYKKNILSVTGELKHHKRVLPEIPTADSDQGKLLGAGSILLNTLATAAVGYEAFHLKEELNPFEKAQCHFYSALKKSIEPH